MYNLLADTDTTTIVVGAGLAGLTAATILARHGRSVTLLEGSHHVGGRATTTDDHGFLLNQGPHALYDGGHAQRILRQLGVRWRGGRVASDSFVALNHALYPLPASAATLARSRLFGLRDKLRLARLMTAIPRLDAANFAHITVDEWVQVSLGSRNARALLQALCRTATYAVSPTQSADAAIMQLALTLRGSVWYLDGGWQTLVDGLREQAEAAGVRIVTSTPVRSLRRADDQWIVTTDHVELESPSVLLAVDPATAAAIVREVAPATAQRIASAAAPIYVATLDLGLAHLPRPRPTAVFSLDQPVYMSVHTRYARLAPGDGALVHLAYYRSMNDPDDAAIKAMLEHALDRSQPGWRDQVRAYRFVPHFRVANTLPTPTSGGLRGRPAPELADVPGIFIAGDWVGDDGLLADAALRSAEVAAQRMLLQSGVHASERLAYAG